MSVEPEMMGDELERPETLVDMISSGIAIMRVENETLAMMAAQRPRKPKAVLAQTLDELDLVPEMAARNYYSIPYKDSSGKLVPVQGPSIKLARSIARNWGNCAIKSLITGEDDNQIYLAGIFTDMQTGMRYERVQTVSKWQYRKGKGNVRISAEKLVQAVQAGASKAERNAIVAGIPDWLTESCYQKSRKLAAQFAREEWKDIAKMLTVFAQVGVTRDIIERDLGHSIQQGLTDDELATLRGKYNALKDGEASVTELFPLETEPTPPDGGSSPTVEQVLAGGATATAGTLAKSNGASSAQGESGPAPEAAEPGLPPASAGPEAEASEQPTAGNGSPAPEPPPNDEEEPEEEPPTPDGPITSEQRADFWAAVSKRASELYGTSSTQAQQKTLAAKSLAKFGCKRSEHVRRSQFTALLLHVETVQ